MLYLFYNGAQPLGIFDYGVGSDTITIDQVQGGMIGLFAEASDTDAPTVPIGDGFDEYGGSGGAHANVKTVIVPATATNGFALPNGVALPLVIMDDGSTGYGTTFGHQFGHDYGSVDYKYYHSWQGGALVGPNTLKGSGKVTGWFTPGVYGTDFYETSTNLDPDDPMVPGTALYINATAAKLCADDGTTATLPTTNKAYFVSFLGDPSLVSTSFNGGTVGGDTTQPVMLFLWK